MTVIKKERNQPKKSAVFMLSTGRSGSGTFAHLFQQSSLFKAFHVPHPEMVEEAYQVQQGDVMPDDVIIEKQNKILEVIGSDERIYFESNPKLVFFAKSLNKFLNTRFIWIIRDPYEYVNSGLSRKWYSGECGIWDDFRECPKDGWPEKWGEIEKIAWKWCCVNSSIETQLAGMKNVKIAHFTDLRKDPKLVLDLLQWAGASDLKITDVTGVFGLQINVGKYSAPRDKITGDHIFGEKNTMETKKQRFDHSRVGNIIKSYWNSLQVQRYLSAPCIKKKSDVEEPRNYIGWLKFLKQCGAKFSKHERLPYLSNEFRSFLRHDIDMFNIELMDQCKDVELSHGVTSAWFFLPPGDKRYAAARPEKIRDYIRSLKEDGFEIGYHVNAWEKPGSYQLAKNPLANLDEDLDWFAETLGEPLKIAVAHGIPRHKEKVSNFSMFDALRDRGVSMLDPFVIRDGGSGKRLPHFGMRTRNPFYPVGLDVTYASDSGGPIRRDWYDLNDVLDGGHNFVLNTHCANYDIRRDFTYRNTSENAVRSREVSESHERDSIKSTLINRIRNIPLLKNIW